MLNLQLKSAVEIDAKPLLASLAEFALPRVAAIPLPTIAPEPTPVPAPSMGGDQELLAMFPKDVAGDPVVVVASLTGPEFAAQGSSAMVGPLTEVLATQGKTIDDVSVAYAGATESGSAILAFRVKGADVAAFADAFLTMVLQGQDAQVAPGEVAGKAVTLLTTSSGTGVAYAHGDVLWLVQATEPALTEIVGKLP
jgi:hypothetical protein